MERSGAETDGRQFSVQVNAEVQEAVVYAKRVWLLKKKEPDNEQVPPNFDRKPKCVCVVSSTVP